MMHKAWSSIEEVPYCFSMSYVKLQGHMAKKIVDFDPNWAFPDCNSSLNSPIAMKCCTKLETAKERCPIVFQGHPSNFKVTRDKTSPILTQIGHFRTIGRSQLSNPSDLPCWLLIVVSKEAVQFFVSEKVNPQEPLEPQLLTTKSPAPWPVASPASAQAREVRKLGHVTSMGKVKCFSVQLVLVLQRNLWLQITVAR